MDNRIIAGIAVVAVAAVLIASFAAYGGDGGDGRDGELRTELAVSDYILYDTATVRSSGTDESHLGMTVVYVDGLKDRIVVRILEGSSYYAIVTPETFLENFVLDEEGLSMYTYAGDETVDTVLGERTCARYTYTSEVAGETYGYYFLVGSSGILYAMGNTVEVDGEVTMTYSATLSGTSLFDDSPEIPAAELAAEGTPGAGTWSDTVIKTSTYIDGELTSVLFSEIETRIWEDAAEGTVQVDIRTSDDDNVRTDTTEEMTVDEYLSRLFATDSEIGELALTGTETVFTAYGSVVCDVYEGTVEDATVRVCVHSGTGFAPYYSVTTGSDGTVTVVEYFSESSLVSAS